MVMVFPYGTLELENNEVLNFKVNSQRVKQYFGDAEEIKLICNVVLNEV